MGVRGGSPGAASVQADGLAVIVSAAAPRYISRDMLRGTRMSAFNIGFVIFPDLTQLDFTGPLQVLNRHAGL